jgi:hypothetical protein
MAEAKSDNIVKEHYESNKASAKTLGRIGIGSAGISAASLSAAVAFAAEGKPVGTALFGVVSAITGYMAVSANTASIECFKPEKTRHDAEDEVNTDGTITSQEEQNTILPIEKEQNDCSHQHTETPKQA